MIEKERKKEMKNKNIEKLEYEFLKKHIYIAPKDDFYFVIGFNKDIAPLSYETYEIVEQEIKKGEGIKVYTENFKENLLILMQSKDDKIRFEAVSAIVRFFLFENIKDIEKNYDKEINLTIKAIMYWFLFLNNKISKDKTIRVLEKAIKNEINTEWKFDLIIKLYQTEGLEGNAEKILKNMIEKKELQEWQYSEFQMMTTHLLTLQFLGEQNKEIEKHIKILNDYFELSYPILQEIISAKEKYEKLPNLKKLKIEADKLKLDYFDNKPLPEIESKSKIITNLIEIELAKKESWWSKNSGRIITAIISAIIGGAISFLITFLTFRFGF